MKKVAEKENGRRRTPAARALVDQLYNALAESSPDGIIVHQQGVLVHANSRALNLYGAVSLAQLQSRSVLELLHPEGGDVVREARLIRQDGSEIQVETYANLIDYGGKKATQVVLRDITARRQAEETLRLSEEKLAKAFASNPAAICMARLNDGVIIEVNEAWEETFGHNRSEAIGKSKMDLDIWPSPDSREKFAQELREKGSFRGREQMLLRKSGEPFVSLASAEVLVIAGEYVVLWTWLDISDRKRAEKALQEANATLEKKVQQRTAQLRALAGELTLAEQRERRRLARILHDHLQQLLVAAKFRIAVLGRGGG